MTDNNSYGLYIIIRSIKLSYIRRSNTTFSTAHSICENEYRYFGGAYDSVVKKNVLLRETILDDSVIPQTVVKILTSPGVKGSKRFPWCGQKK